MKNLVILFEDTKSTADIIEKSVQNSADIIKLIRFHPTIESHQGAYEDRIKDELSKSPYLGARLIISDRDLSATDDFCGLSEAVISKVANQLAIPVALYASGYKDDILDRKNKFGDARIVLSIDSIGEQAPILASGFEKIHLDLAKILEMKGNERPRSPAAVMAHLLNHPELTDQIGLYGAGDQKMVSEILPFIGVSQKKELANRLPCLLGYWLYDSILKFPGLLVNEIAAASYLNIAPEDFSKPNVQELFSFAKYNGPFSNTKTPLWWRGMLDEIIQNNECIDGNEVASKKLSIKLSECFCSVDSTKKAGWYCMATNKPIGFESSKGNISWFPAGADLSRIQNDIYDEVGPWLGLF